LIKYPNPTGENMADKATRKKRISCDLLQIRNFITNKAKAILRNKEMGAKEWEVAVVEAGFAAYKHPRYKRKPHDASIKAAIRREFRKFAGTTAPKKKGKKKVVRGKAGSGKTLRQKAPINFDTDYFPPHPGVNPRRQTPPYEPYGAPEDDCDPYGYKKAMAKNKWQEPAKHPLGGISELSRKTDLELNTAKAVVKDLIRKQEKMLEDIHKLQNRKAKIDEFLNGKETLEILALLQQ
jgi:hypothetical protein